MKRLHRRIAIVVLALALPAFAFLTFDELLRGGTPTGPREGVAAAPTQSLGSRIFAAGERLRRAKQEPEPESAVVAAPVLPETVTVPVLVYHNVRPPQAGRRLSARDAAYDMTPAQFEAQMRYLKDGGYAATSLDAIVRALTEGTSLPEKPVVITIDDGRQNQIDYALPVLEKYGLKASFFIFTNAIDREGYFTAGTIRTLAENGMEMCSHSRYHPYLTKATDEELTAEIAGSKASLEATVGAPVRCFAYPFGLSDERVQKAVQDAGYAVGRGLRHGVSHSRTDLFDLKAHIVTGDFGQFKAVMERK